MLNFSEKGSPALLLTARLLTSRWEFAYFSLDIPKVGTFYSQGGNVLFPGWEQLLPLMLAIAAFNGSRIFIKWLLLMDKCHFFHPLPLKFRNAFI